MRPLSPMVVLLSGLQCIMFQWSAFFYYTFNIFYASNVFYYITDDTTLFCVFFLKYSINFEHEFKNNKKNTFLYEKKPKQTVIYHALKEVQKKKYIQVCIYQNKNYTKVTIIS